MVFEVVSLRIFLICSSDLAVLTEEGLLKIVGRVKDLIIRGGENIYPAEVENVLYECPLVKEAHVCGVPDKRLGEEICAWVMLKQDHLTVQEEKHLRNFCAGKVSCIIPLYFVNVNVFLVNYHIIRSSR